MIGHDDACNLTLFDNSSDKPRRLRCGGGDPTLTNLDQVIVDPRDAIREQYVRIDATSGSFAPGLTDEEDGSSEIEFDVSIDQAGAHPIAALNYRGTAADGTIEARVLGSDPIFNLNASKPTPDIDITLHQPLDARPSSQVDLYIRGCEGTDTISPTGGPYTDRSNSASGTSSSSAAETTS